jgi:hypothetical protein
MHKRKSITAELEETTTKSSKKARPAMSVVGMYFLSPSHWLVCMAAWKVRLQPACLNLWWGNTRPPLHVMSSTRLNTSVHSPEPFLSYHAFSLHSYRSSLLSILPLLPKQNRKRSHTHPANATLQCHQLQARRNRSNMSARWCR